MMILVLLLPTILVPVVAIVAAVAAGTAAVAARGAAEAEAVGDAEEDVDGGVAGARSVAFLRHRCGRSKGHVHAAEFLLARAHREDGNVCQGMHALIEVRREGA